MSFKNVPVEGTIVLGIPAPKLEKLKSGKCTKAELQSALVQLIEIVNMNEAQFRTWASQIESSLRDKEPKKWRATV
jgi:hypothetical protein